MARSDELGERQDRVRLLLDGKDVNLYGRYQVATSVFQQPAAFSMTLGWPRPPHELAKKYPPNTPFELRIGDVGIQSGQTDSCDPEGGEGGSSVHIEGRDALAPLYDAYVASERSFANKTYLEFVAEILAILGIDRMVIAGNAANRKAITGSKVVADQWHDWVGETEIFVSGTTYKTVHNSIKVQLGHKWLDVIQTELKKAGIFLWAGVDGNLYLEKPNADKPAYARIVHRRGQTRDDTSVITAKHRNNIAQRYTRAVVYGRGGGRKFGRRKLRAEYADPEMVKILGAADRKEIVYHEPEVDTVKGAEFMARRRIAELNRNGWNLEYTVSGHTTRGLRGESRVVWAPDTVIEVDDTELDIHGRFYVSDVTFDRGPQTTTTLKLMRPEDLVFGEDAKKAS